MNGAKTKAFGTCEAYEDANWLRLTIQLNAWDQRYLSEMAAAEGKKTPAFIGDLIREKLKEAREAAGK